MTHPFEIAMGLIHDLRIRWGLGECTTAWLTIPIECKSIHYLSALSKHDAYYTARWS
jgi:hypothetical protein